MPRPKLLSRWPEASKWRIGSTSGEFRHEFAPQRSAIQTDWPSGAMATALVDPHDRPSGSLK